MKVALTSYPMLFQRLGGLQVQVHETLAALRDAGTDAVLLDPVRDRLSNFDITHVFGAVNGNHRIIEAAVDAGSTTVLSPVLHPPFRRVDAALARFADRLTGRLTHWDFQTTYGHVEGALRLARRLISLGVEETRLMVDGYRADRTKVVEIPNGVAGRFFEATGDAFRSHQQMAGPYVIQVGSIGPYKNQLTSVRAVLDERVPSELRLVLIGPCNRDQQAYLESVLAEGADRVVYAGAFPPDDLLLASAYAGADALLLPSRSEVMPLVALEALASGTPAIITRHSSLELVDSGPWLSTVDPRESGELADKLANLLRSSPSTARCRKAVEGYSWKSVAEQVRAVYEDAIATG